MEHVEAVGRRETARKRLSSNLETVKI